MGGMLGCGILSQAGDSKYSEALKSLICYGSGCFGDGSWHSLLKRIVVPVTKLGFPADLACQGMSLLTDKPAALSVFETLFYWFPNVDKGVRKRLLQSCFNYIVRRDRGAGVLAFWGPGVQGFRIGVQG
jgi:hypothetical protein